MGNNFVNWTTKSTQGLYGGLTILRRNYVLAPSFSFVGEGFIGIYVYFKSKVCCFVNVYSSCRIALEIKFWEELILLKQKMDRGE